MLPEPRREDKGSFYWIEQMDLPIGQITVSCGFRSENHAKALFKARYGHPMREWRRASRDG